MQLATKMSSSMRNVLFTCLVVFYLISLMVQLSHSVALRPTRLVNGTFPISTSGRRMLESNSISAKAELVHRDSSSQDQLTLTDKVRGFVDRSNSRAKYLARFLNPAGANDVAPTDFQSPVSVGNGEYVMALNLGTPAKTYSVIVDTGSDLTWVQCSPCSTCFEQPNPMFDPSSSSSYAALGCSNSLCQTLPVVEGCSPCQYFYEYGDQSTTIGIFSQDTVTMATTSGGTQQVGNVAFGCGHDNQGSFSGVDGLLGLGQGPISFTSQLSSLFGGKFSYCLVSLMDSSSQTSPLLFGNAAIPSGAVKYTPIVQNSHHPTYYYVGLTGISVGGTLLNIPASVFGIDSSGSGGTILDSGTTITQLVGSAYKVVIQAFQSQMQYSQVSGSASGLDLCFDVSGAPSSGVTVPTLSFHFDQADIDLPAENYFVMVDNQGTLCLAMAGSYGFSIYGNIQQQNFQILFDRSGGRVGFKQMQCDTL
ncbi:unnamed protein product [Calypogeia fissa]